MEKKEELLQKWKKDFWLVAAVVTASLTLSGCSKIQILDSGKKNYTKTPYTAEQLASDKYYVKDGADFFAPYTPSNSNNLFYGNDDLVEIPTLYKNEYLAYRSTTVSSLKDIAIQRYRDDGKSFAVTGFVRDGDFLTADLKNVIKGSSIAQTVSGKKGKEIRIAEINGRMAKKIKITKAGVITGYGNVKKSVHISYYIGTTYYQGNVIPDTHFFEQYEDFTVSDKGLTKVGYLQVSLPEDAKSGYYSVDGGLFRYYAHDKKNDAEDSAENMNTPYYSKTVLNISKDAKKYNINLKKAMTNIGFKIEYQDNDTTAIDSSTDSGTADSSYSPLSSESAGLADENGIMCMMISPSGQQYDIACKDGEGKLELAAAEAGRWVAVIKPMNIVVTDISAYSTKPEESATEIDKYLSFKRPGNYEVQILYKGTGKVWGTVDNLEDQSSNVFSNTDADNGIDDTASGIVKVQLSIPKSGKYIIRIYHYNSNTEIANVKAFSLDKARVFRFK